MAASGSGYSGPNRFKLKLLPFCPPCFYRQLLLAPSVMLWDSLGQVAHLIEAVFWRGSFWAGLCCWTGSLCCCMSIVARKGLTYIGLSCQRATLWAKDKDCASLPGWTASCWYGFGKILILPLYFNYRVAVACCGHTNMWLKTEYCCASTVEQSHKVVVWRPRRSFRGKVCSGTAELRSRPTGHAGCCWTMGFHSTWVICSDQLRISWSQRPYKVTVDVSFP